VVTGLTRRRRLVAGAGAALVALGLSFTSAPAASADDLAPGDEGYSANPFYFAPDELPPGIPFALSHSALAKMTVADLASGPPTCAAPAPLAATSAGSPEGYTVPVRIKLTNGTMLAGYSAAAAHYGQKIPFTSRLAGLTGWVNARIQLPSMKVLVLPHDVTFCDSGYFALAYTANGAIFPPDYGIWDCGVDCVDPRQVQTQPDDGATFVAIPGTIQGPSPADDDGYLYGPPGADSRVDVRDLVANSIDARVTGLGADGSLNFSVDLKLGATVAQHVTVGAPAFSFPVDIAGTFSTAVKLPVAPQSPDGLSWVSGLPERPSYLPAKTLSGAVEGSTATIGSNRFTFDNTRLDAVSPTDPGRSVAVSIAPLMVGTDKYGVTLLQDWPWQDNFAPWISGVLDGSQPFPQIPSGAADVSMDMTIDQIGLPRGIPAGYGWDG